MARNLIAQPGRFFLHSPCQGQTVGRDIPRNYAAGADKGAVPDLNGGHQRRVGADERTGADVCAMFLEAVVVTEDGTGANVGFQADPGVADIGQMVGLRAGLEMGVFDFDEIADFGVCANVRARTKARIGAKFGAIVDYGSG